MALSMIRKTSFVLFAAGVAFVGSACKESEARVYYAPKDNNVELAQNNVSSGRPTGGRPARSDISWTVPQGWREKPADGMRAGSFEVNVDGHRLDISVIPLPGQSGSELDNVNRWRGQVKLPLISEEEMQKAAKPLQVGSEEARVYLMTSKEGLIDHGGHKDKMSIAAAVLKKGDTTWFYKMSGPEDMVGENLQKFTQFVASTKFAGAQEPKTDTASADAGLPKTWKEVPATTMLRAKYAVQNDKGTAEVTVSSFPGNVGGLTANVNRWRAQMGLPPAGEAEIRKSTSPVLIGNVEATLVDISNEKTKKRLLTVMLPKDGNTWFYKLTGEAEAVAAERDALIKFVKNAKQK